NGLLTQPTIGYVYDLQGRVVQSKALEANRVSQQMDVSRLSTGIYLVTITNNQNRYTKKIVVN
ncbi:MAG: T9SS type A sorting domain-containing protein, partial [Flavobacteriaceae bacterium]|nr:T9SS type A sorting domain-containing protein [Flavobacteriaceae bacterium]